MFGSTKSWRISFVALTLDEATSVRRQFSGFPLRENEANPGRYGF
jgi:hypothetical protein